MSEIGFYQIEPLETVFLGGGTPSLAPIDFLNEFFSKLSFEKNVEVTLESNPSSVSFEKASQWKKLGVNRVSLGVQALNDERLKWLGRVHSKEAAFRALDSLHQANIERLTIDYIVGVPDQTPAIIESELAEILSKFPNIKHVSAYLLTLKQSNSKFSELPDENVQLLHLRTVRDTLASFGLSQYEISNFAASGFEARHNLNYWHGGSYLGIGPSAHSFDFENRSRWKNWASLGKYCDAVEEKAPPIEWEETLSREQERLEYLMLRLRTREGLSFEDYRQRFEKDLFQDNRGQLDKWASASLVAISENQLQLKNDGYFLSDSIIEHLK